MGRRGRDVETGQRGEETQYGEERWQWQQNRQSHIHVWWIKIIRDTYLGSEQSKPQTRLQGPDFQGAEDKIL